MSDTKFTPGPWFVGAMNDALFVINEAPRPVPTDVINTTLKTKMIAKPTEPHEEGWARDEYEANANLIAAAPEMYEALKVARQYVEWCATREGWLKNNGTDLQAIDAALAKADGRQV